MIREAKQRGEKRKKKRTATEGAERDLCGEKNSFKEGKVVGVGGVKGNPDRKNQND